ncbi:Gram-negative bacterial tonB protein [Amantichitinum ursilacus]|uniref:Gram-negative bacterial tonB protein n=2 Tax=Amantichitinum ursilacus TaxID=857265 RepID=A0A0N0GMV6_9NEIS|nr:Gram-negative bacterial tonB protein [Amantichitinum ursilacus]
MDRAQRFMTTALVASALVHAATILGIRIVSPQPDPALSSQFLQVELVNKATATAPTKAKVRAQVNLDAGGNTDANQQAASPLPVKEDKTDTELQQILKEARELEQNQAQLMSQIKQTHNQVSALDNPAQSQQTQQSNGQDAQKQTPQLKDVNGLAGKIEREFNQYQQRPRKASIGVPAIKSQTAGWEDQWRHKVERLGTALYPVDAHGNKLYGQLTLTVEVNRDGTLRSVTVDKSSGSRALDEAAVALVHRSAPFAPLPKNLVDAAGNPVTVLIVPRVWTFTRNSELLVPSGPQ